MIEASINEALPEGLATEPGAPSGELAPARQAFSYCVECGSWGAHDFECACCGYNFRTPAPKIIRSD